MSKKKTAVPTTGEFLLYTSADGQVRIETRMQDETVWLTQKQMAELFGKDLRTISEHVVNIYDEGELLTDGTIRKFRIVPSVRRELQAFSRKPMYMSPVLS